MISTDSTSAHPPFATLFEPLEIRRPLTGEDGPWRVVVMPPARHEHDRLQISVAAAVLETLDAIAENPRRLGRPLMLEHEGRFSARRGPYWIIYELEEDGRLVRVIAIGHRRDVRRR